MNLYLRSEQEGDAGAIYRINAEAFNRPQEAILVGKLRESSSFIKELSVVALHDLQPVGHLLFTPIHIVDPGGVKYVSLALAPMAVLPAYQRQGIGSRLITFALEKARALGFGSVIVLGHKNFYTKFGFSPAYNWGIKAPFKVPADAFMAMELKEGGLSKISGTVEYPKEFAEV